MSLSRGDRPNSWKKTPKMHGQMKTFHVGYHQFRESLRELLRELWFSQSTGRETPFREWDFAFRELFSELWELLREYPGTLPELQEWPFHSESVFPEIEVAPRLLNGRKTGNFFGVPTRSQPSISGGLKGGHLKGGHHSEVPKMFLHKFCAFFLNLDDTATCMGNKCLNLSRHVVARPPWSPGLVWTLTQERKRHININKFFRWLPGWGGVSRPGGQGSPDRWPGVKSLCGVCGTQGTQTFSSGHPAGRIGYPTGSIGDRGDREIVYVPNVYVPFLRTPKHYTYTCTLWLFWNSFPGVMQLSGCHAIIWVWRQFFRCSIQNTATSTYTPAITHTPFNCFFGSNYQRITLTLCNVLQRFWITSVITSARRVCWKTSPKLNLRFSTFVKLNCRGVLGRSRSLPLSLHPSLSAIHNYTPDYNYSEKSARP